MKMLCGIDIDSPHAPPQRLLEPGTRRALMDQPITPGWWFVSVRAQDEGHWDYYPTERSIYDDALVDTLFYFYGGTGKQPQPLFIVRECQVRIPWVEPQ